jgi:hypothetical protein
MAGPKKDRSFLICCVLSGLVVYSASTFHLLTPWRWLEGLMSGSGLVVRIAQLVAWLSLWVWLFLLVRWWKTWKERNLMMVAHHTVDEATGLPEDLDTAFGQSEQWKGLYEGSQLQERLRLWEQRLSDFNRSDRLSFLMMGQSGIEAARLESIYGPPRALVWALPGLGFMGTAFEMSAAVGRFATMPIGDPSRVLDGLLHGVIPALSNAFQITLFALGSSVISFLLLSLAHRREEKILHSADALSLKLLARVEDEGPQLLLNDENSRYLGTGLRDLRTVLQVLAMELENIRSVLPNEFSPNDDE